MKKTCFIINLALLALFTLQGRSHASVNSTVYVDAAYGNDTTGVREDPTHPFQTLTGAVGAAHTGDQIEVHAGTYTDSNINTKNVNWNFENGVILQPGNGANTLIDDSPNVGATNTACTVTITGSAVLDGSIVLYQPTSTLIANFREIHGGTFGEQIAVLQCGGALYLTVDSILDCNNGNATIWWEDGPGYIHAKQIANLSDGDYGTIMFTPVDNSDPGNQLYIECDELFSAFDNDATYIIQSTGGSGAIPFSPTNFDSSKRMWIRAKQIHCPDSSGDAISLSAGKVYIESEKIIGSIWTGGTETFISAQKINGGIMGGFAGNGPTWITAQTLDDTGVGINPWGLGVAPLIVAVQSDLNVNVQNIERTTQGQIAYVYGGTLNLQTNAKTDGASTGIVVAGGTLNLFNSTIDTSSCSASGANPISIQLQVYTNSNSSVTNLIGSNLIAGGSQDSIVSPTTAEAVTSNFSTVNNPVDANTYVFGTFSIGGALQAYGSRKALTQSASPYAASAADSTIAITTLTSGFTVNLPSSAASGGLPSAVKRLLIKDEAGAAASHTITIAPHGSELIDGSNSPVTITTNFGSVSLYNTGTAWFTGAAP